MIWECRRADRCTSAYRCHYAQGVDDTHVTIVDVTSRPRNSTVPRYGRGYFNQNEELAPRVRGCLFSRYAEMQEYVRPYSP